MSTKTNVTRPQAEAVLAAVLKRYSGVINGFTIPADSVIPDPYVVPPLPEAERPQLVEDYLGEGSWAVVWETGPDEWAYRFTMGGVDEGTASALHHEFGLTKAEAGRRSTEKPAELPKRLAAKVHVEPYFSYSLGIYEA